MVNVILLILLIAALVLAQGVFYLARYLGEKRDDELKRRLRTLGEAGAAAVGVTILRKRRLAENPAIAELLAGQGWAERLEMLIEHADVDTTVATVVAAMGGLAGAGALAGALIGGKYPLPAGLMFAMLAAGLPLLLLGNAKDKRADNISVQLPEALDMMARAIRAGHALTSSFKLIAQEMAPPVSVEFARAYEQQNLGLSFETAVNNMCERVPGNLDLRLFAVTVNIQKETGGNLVEVLEKIAHTMRERFKFYSKLRALTAEARISAWILAALPIAVALVLFAFTGMDYIGELFVMPGLYILGGAFVMWVLGLLTIRSLMKVEY